VYYAEQPSVHCLRRVTPYRPHCPQITFSTKQIGKSDVGSLCLQLMTPSPLLRQPCPPGACDCGREQLLATSDGDLRILRLTRQEEKRLLERLENIESLSDLEKLQQRMYEQLGIRLDVAPGFNEVRSMRGIAIHIDQLPGLCRKTRQSLPTAIRRGLEKHPEIAYRLLDAHDLFRGT
jgi:hypothetical protein